MGDDSDAFATLLASLDGSSVVLFPHVSPSQLDGFFRLRLAQLLLDQAALPALSVVVLSKDECSTHLGGGFANRFQASWPFARCVFVTYGEDPRPDLIAELGLPVTRLDDPGSKPQILHSTASHDQKIAVQIQPIWGRCGSTTAFQNQVEDLVRIGFFTVRVFAERDYRRGVTLDSMVHRIIAENNPDAGAHVDIVAVPTGAPPMPLPDEHDASWATYLAGYATCQIDDQTVRQAAQIADIVIANHITNLGLALRIAPQAALILDVHDDMAAAQRQAVLLGGGSQQQADIEAEFAARAQANVLAIPDLCTHVNIQEKRRLGHLSQRTEIVLPRVYVRSVQPAHPASFDLFLVGDKHVFNIQSVCWFLDEVWRPYLQQANVTVAIAGRVGSAIDMTRYASPLLHIAGFVLDIDDFRATCKLTVVPDQGGTGVPVKMLTTLASGHPVATTKIGLRGLDPSITAILPSFDDPKDLAQDILDLISSEDRLLTRRDLVRQVQHTIQLGPSYADCVQSISRPDQKRLDIRATQWSVVIAESIQLAVEPHIFEQDVAFSMAGTRYDDSVLIAGWHGPEDWGRWMDGGDAKFQVTMPAPVDIPLGLDLDLIPSSVGASLAVAVDDVSLATIDPVVGSNILIVPHDLIAGKSRFEVALHASETVCPADVGSVPDQRVLGVAFRGIRLVSRAPTTLSVGQQLRLSGPTLPCDVLLRGWHAAEEWGCWTKKTDATLRLAFAEPLSGTFRLDLDLVPQPTPGPLTLTVNEHVLPSVVASPGQNSWTLPPTCTENISELSVTLSVKETFCPARSSGSGDDRLLGIGLKAVGLHRIEMTPAPLNENIRISRDTPIPGILRAGWHPPEAWGCWSDGPNAVLALEFQEVLCGAMVLQMNIALPIDPQPMTVVVNDTALPEKPIKNGINLWVVPRHCFEEQTSLVIQLRVGRAIRPSDLNGSNDHRTIGIGLRTVGVHTLTPL